MIWLLFAVVAIWLSLLSILAYGIVRHLSTLELASRAGAVPRLELNFDADGPEVGTAVPGAILEMIQGRIGRPASNEMVFLFSPGCGTCLEIASAIVGRPTLAARSVFVVRGPTTGGAAEELRDLLRRVERPIIDGEEARVVMRELNINSVPFGVSLDHGNVLAKRYLRRSVQLDDLAAGPIERDQSMSPAALAT